ncbi:MAG TPA: cupredoxin family copper-binding protein [Stellaceae bacterium]|nr:cupredoxin family copper-binding protein [Stellaceae bacterium]
MSKILLLAAALAVAPSAVFAGETVTAANAPATVAIHNFQFVPATLTVVAGTTITWQNDDSSPHTVTEKGRVFHSAALDTKETFSYTFTKPGEFTYFCTLHPMMTGRIIVEPAGSSS